jgi:hypothetical protein
MGSGNAQAVTLNTPGVGSASQGTTTSLTLSWGVSSALPHEGGYLILRSASSGGPYSKVSSGTCDQTITVVSAATSCADTGLTADTTYYYEVEAVFYDVSTLWASTPDAQFSGTTGQAAANPAPTGGPPPSETGAPVISSASSTSFFVGSAGSFQVTASGSPAPTFSNAAFSGCTPSTLPAGISFSGSGLLSGTPSAGAVGSYTVCINGVNSVAPLATQVFTLTISTETLVISSAAVSGATSGTPNLGPITVRRQSGSGTPITTGGALIVNLASSPSTGATFGTIQFAAAPVTSVTIPNGQSTTTFWYGSTTAGGPMVTASATDYVSGTQQETIAAAPAGLAMALAAGSTGTPLVSCGAPSGSETCTVTGVGTSGSVAFSVNFLSAGQSPVVYSSTQASTVSETGQSTGAVTIGAGASGSAPKALSASLGTSTLIFGPYTLTINVALRV